MGPGELIALDTSVVVHLARGDGTGQHLEDEYRLTTRTERPLISTVTEAELLGLALTWKWGSRKIDLLRKILSELVRVEAGLPEIVDAYASLFYQMTIRGKHSGQNDLWIAATAQATDAILMTCDHDFDWMSPDLVKVCFVPETR